MLSRTNSTLSAKTEEVARRCIGCAIAVHRTLGPGFLEGVYQDALWIELEEAGLSARREVPISVTYRRRPLRQYRIDLLVEELIVVEIKAVERFERIHQAQLISYLKSTRLRLGLLFNFNSEVVAVRRVVL